MRTLSGTAMSTAGFRHQRLSGRAREPVLLLDDVRRKLHAAEILVVAEVVSTSMSPTIGWSIQVWTLATSPLHVDQPVILYLPPTVNETSVPPVTPSCVALFAIAALRNPAAWTKSPASARPVAGAVAAEAPRALPPEARTGGAAGGAGGGRIQNGHVPGEVAADLLESAAVRRERCAAAARHRRAHLAQQSPRACCRCRKSIEAVYVFTVTRGHGSLGVKFWPSEKPRPSPRIAAF